jgi:dihydroxyacetone kinase-like predicted kinase
VLGAVGGDVVVVGEDIEVVALDVVARLLSSGGELVTVVVGVEASEGLGAELAERIRVLHRDVEVSVIEGGQPHYPVLVGVE